MKEAHFSTEVVRSVRHYGGWAYKIPDAPITKAILKITRFTAAKPFDITCAIDGTPVAIETKQFKEWKALSKNDFRPEQLKGMTEFIAHGKGRAFVFLNIRIKEADENRLIIFDWATLGPRIEQKKSVFAKELKERAYYKSYLHDFTNDDGIVTRKRVFDLTEWLFLL